MELFQNHISLALYSLTYTQVVAGERHKYIGQAAGGAAESIDSRAQNVVFCRGCSLPIVQTWNEHPYRSTGRGQCGLTIPAEPRRKDK